ncbi:GPW/gp25 family protein [Niabella ginsengisoli]|uniref:GPW/gp25 family protein n=1 Tax=Niabella ginsengisoli TaxID=522298 RepID=A0ABS9SGP6_9BACT|nr:GPW/gp25 family protein [Niabella ginsengisoli]MCH5597543.1 GPW/gp25 family protein [Niabella ginsengisoli]
MPDYLKLPLRFQHCFENKKLPACTLLDSVYRNLHLIITTVPGENKTDEHYGSSFWESDYDIHLNNDVRKELIINSLKQQITRYEKRITDVALDVNVRLASAFVNNIEVQKKKIEIVVKGKTRRNMEPFTFQTGFFISPYTLD